MCFILSSNLFVIHLSVDVTLLSKHESSPHLFSMLLCKSKYAEVSFPDLPSCLNSKFASEAASSILPVKSTGVVDVLAARTMRTSPLDKFALRIHRWWMHFKANVLCPNVCLFLCCHGVGWCSLSLENYPLTLAFILIFVCPNRVKEYNNS